MAAGLFLFGIGSSGLKAEKITYPETRTVDHVDEYHGVKVLDRFQWLENDVREDPEVEQWVKDQNKVTFGYIKKLRYRKEIEERLTSLWDYEKFSSPFKVADKYCFFKNDGLQNQSVLYRIDTLDSEPVLVIDPNTWSEDGTVALGGLAFTDDGRYMAYGIQTSGSDWRQWRVMDLNSGKLLDDELNWLKFTRVTWLKDGSGFYCSRFPEPEKGEAFQSANLNSKIYFHKLGTSQSDDRLVYEDPEHPKWGFSPYVTEDGDYLIITVSKGTDDRYRIYYQSLSDADSKIVKLITNFDHEYSFIENYGSRFYFKSNLDAPMGKVIVIDVDKPDQKTGKQLCQKPKKPWSTLGWSITPWCAAT